MLIVYGYQSEPKPKIQPKRHVTDVNLASKKSRERERDAGVEKKVTDVLEMPRPPKGNEHLSEDNPKCRNKRPCNSQKVVSCPSLFVAPQKTHSFRIAA